MGCRQADRGRGQFVVKCGQGSSSRPTPRSRTLITALPHPALKTSQTDTGVGLGLDAGGSATRWALVDGAGSLLGEGRVPGLTALLLGSEAGRTEISDTLGRLAQDVRQAGVVSPVRTVAGFSGYSDDSAVRARLEALVAQALQLDAGRVRVVSDITLAYLDCFAPGAGYLVYAGTGSIAVGIEPGGRVCRAGGRGGLLDDGGSGYWMAREALQHIWRCEDEAPGSWSHSALARRVFERIGGSSWAQTRAFVYQGSRGAVGELALAVAAAAHDGDAVALDILRRAGIELARLAFALTHRLGPRQVALAGRAAQLHPVILSAMADAMSGRDRPELIELQSHRAAARLAVNNDPILMALSDA